MEEAPAVPREEAPAVPREEAPAVPREEAPAVPRGEAPAVPDDVIDTSKLKAKVWEHMTKKIVDGKVKAVCNYCKSKLAGSSNAGTRHLSAHVDNCIRKTQASNPGALQKLLATKKVDGKTVIANYSFDQGVCRKDLVKMIVLHEHPLSIVDQVGFKVFCNSLQPLFKVPTRNTVRADVFELYKTEMKKTKELLEKNEGRVAITTDMWTADHQKKSYMAVTAHFVDQSWGLQQRLLSTPKKIEKFEEAARQLRITCNKKLSYDVKTRWNSTYTMLETALAYKDVFPRLKKRDAQYKCLPSEPDWEKAKIISEKLKIFYDTTELFSGTKYTTANHYFSSICEIRLALLHWQIDSNPTVAKMASNMMNKFEKYWKKIHGIMGIATLLDPRFKKELIIYYYEKIYGDDHEKEVRNIVDLCRELFREYQRRVSKKQVEKPIESEGVRVGNIPRDFESFAQSRKKMRIDITTELDHYLGEKLMSTSSPNFNVLTWWMSNGPKFPTLQKIARDIFAIPVSSVASESAFSAGGRIISPHRNRLTPQLVQALTCAQNWLKAEFEELGERNPFTTYWDDVDCDEQQQNDMSNEDDFQVRS
ncbi:Zinc finger BED domain-containing protein DAYSLEEPER [Rhynchospora pubera]|uniref:Zinc finger BED domain-containing protein DAYSLEEPER n=1 Tax=Rhynchospora pubera TaxID=906938 RepID=A0AAV8D2H7_9POAL|nr:Zinc finger BED domain-containing protein DAYSLEEPER [Rhynchospora pubera]